MAQGPSDTILVAIRITLRIRESKVRNPDPPDRRRFVLSEHSFVVFDNLYLPSSRSIHLLSYQISVRSIRKWRWLWSWSVL